MAGRVATADLRAALLAAGRRLPPEPEPDIEPTAPLAPSSFVRSERSWLVPTAIVVAVAPMALAKVTLLLLVSKTGVAVKVTV